VLVPLAVDLVDHRGEGRRHRYPGPVTSMDRAGLGHFDDRRRQAELMELGV
jgi:hypothetical protein